MTKTHLFLLVTIVFFLPSSVKAKHLIGGEMSYKCIGNGDYEITLRVYRDCLTDGAEFDRSAFFSIFQCDGTIDCTELTQGSQGFVFEVDLDTVETLNNPDPTCELPQLCVEQGIYRFRMSEFEAFLPNINNSYHIVHQRCCRNGGITNIVTPEEFGNTFTIAITPTAQELCNTSPNFENFPPVIACINEPFEFQQIASDEEGDSLVYVFSTPLHGGGNDVTRDNFQRCVGAIPNPPCPPPFGRVSFVGPLYDVEHPFGNSEQAITLRSSTGLIAGTPTLAGQFVVGLSVKEYRNGTLLSLTQREFQINVVDCQNTNDRIGSACNDANPNTENDRIQEDCSCRGVLTEEAKNTKDLFISEYFESTSASQCIELYNPTNQIISSGSYVLKLYSDTFPEGQILHTIGDIPPHETYLVCQEESDTSLINAANGTFDIRFDGNEAIAIEQGTILVDLFGNRSCFPTDFWRGNIGLRSQNATVVRCPCIQNGVKIDPTACGFPTFSGDWISLPTDDVSRLGKHDTLAPEDSFFEDLTDIYCACAETCRERDSLILVDFYNATNGGIWFQSWDLTRPLDTWFGVFLNEEGCVSCIDLDGVGDCDQSVDNAIGNNLQGTLTDRLGELEMLEALYLSNNQLTNIIPRSIGKLTQIKKIWLNNNDLSGDFPVGFILLDQLQEVVVDSNRLTGELPPEMAQLEQLSIFTASNNQLTGCFPDTYLALCSSNTNFSDNPALPWQGNFETFCAESTSQLGVICNDGDEATSLDNIQFDCTCKGQRNIEPLVFSTPCRSFAQGEESCLPFQVSNFKKLRGIQMQLIWNPTVLEFTALQVEPALSSLSQNSFDTTQTGEGQLGLFWADENSLLGNDLVDGDTLFKICFVQQTLDSIKITINDENNLPFQTIALTTDLEEVAIMDNICNPSNGDCTAIEALGVVQDAFSITTCEDSVTLFADAFPSMFTSRWVSNNDSVAINNQSSSTITIQDIPVGMNSFVWQTDTVNCTWYLPTLYEVRRLAIPPLQADTFLIMDQNKPFKFDILANDNLIDSFFYTTNIIQPTQDGILNDLGDGTYEWLPTALADQDQFIYEVCYEECPFLCNQTIVTFQLQAMEEEVENELPEIETAETNIDVLPNAITPNGDGLNDQLVFSELVDPQAFPNNELLIFNRWGDEVFIAHPYDNAWNGVDQHGQALLEGTYYYLLRLEVGAGVVLKGTVVVLR